MDTPSSKIVYIDTKKNSLVEITYCFFNIIIQLAHPQDSLTEMATDASEFFASVETLRANVESFDLEDESSRPGSQNSTSKLGKMPSIKIIIKV